MARQNVEFAQFSLQVFDDIVLANKAYVDLILSDAYTHKTYYMGTVDANNHVNFYDGMIRVVSPSGKEADRYLAKEYADHIAERVEPWTYLKFPYLKKCWLEGLCRRCRERRLLATPLSRLNAADGMATPLAQAAFERFYTTLGSKKNGRYEPVHYRLATHWARLVELLYAAERMLELVQDQEITDPNVRPVITTDPTKASAVSRRPGAP